MANPESEAAQPRGDTVEPVEVERKFLPVVEAIGYEINNFRSDEIRQGYVSIDTDGTETRVRDKSGEFTLTVKKGSGQIRGEWEIDITENQFKELWRATEGAQIEKTRFYIDLDEDTTVELDVYHGPLAGLVTAEVEFSDPESADAFEPPEWLGREITHNPAFKNQNLAVHGLPNSF